MQQICIQPDFLMSLLDEVSRHRALSESESMMLEATLQQGHRSQSIRFRWTATLDRQLLQASTSRGGIKRFAIVHNITLQAASNRVLRLRKAQLNRTEWTG